MPNNPNLEDELNKRAEDALKDEVKAYFEGLRKPIPLDAALAIDSLVSVQRLTTYINYKESRSMVKWTRYLVFATVTMAIATFILAVMTYLK
ncbi:MAG: hypothetical protein H3Z52_12715 [archaeon]|nr:hypothetical protein [archaeon]MCP8321780.1 hypothetical protein [archaeon]